MNIPGVALKSLHLFITIGAIPMLFWTMTLLIPFKATILAFIMGSVIASKSVKHKQNTVRQKSLYSTWNLRAGRPAEPTNVREEGVTGTLANHSLHLTLLLLLLPFLVKEVLQQERLLLQQKRTLLLAVLTQILV